MITVREIGVNVISLMGHPLDEGGLAGSMISLHPDGWAVRLSFKGVPLLQAEGLSFGEVAAWIRGRLEEYRYSEHGLDGPGVVAAMDDVESFCRRHSCFGDCHPESGREKVYLKIQLRSAESPRLCDLGTVIPPEDIRRRAEQFDEGVEAYNDQVLFQLRVLWRREYPAPGSESAFVPWLCKRHGFTRSDAVFTVQLED
jgi:hypothetical protein